MAFRYLTLVIVLSSVALGSCSSGGSSDESAATTEPAALAFVDEPKSTVSVDIGVRGLNSFDPVQLDGSSIGAAAVSDLLYRSLTRIDADGTVESDGAGEWSHNDDATRWNFELAEEFVFSDGTSVTAADVVTSLERALDDAPRHMTIGLEDVQTIVVANESSVVLRLSEPDLDVPEALASPVFGIVDSNEGSLGEFSTGVVAVTERTEDTWQLEGVGFDISVSSVADDEALLEGLEDGDFDVVFSAADRVDLPTGVSEIDPGVGALRYVGLNTNDSDLRTAASREVLLRSLDVESFTQEFDYAEPVGAPLCPAMCEGSDDAKASQLLAKLGQIEVLHVNTDNGNEAEIADLVVKRLQKAGIEAASRGLEPVQLSENLAEGRFQVAVLGWLPSLKSDVGFLEPMMTSDGSLNVFGLDNDAIDTLFDEGAASDPKGLDLLARQAVLAPLFRDDESVLVSHNAGDLMINPDGTLDFESLAEDAE